jgi:hypothetical protein
MELSHPAVVVLITVAVLLVLELVVLLALSGGDFGRIRLATSLFFRALRDPEFAAKAQPLLEPPKPAEPPKPSPEPVRLLTLLQRGDGRFLDFVLEDVNAVDDSQIAAAVRAMQPVWKTSLQEHLTFEPVRAEPEGSAVEVPPGFDPSAVLLTGNVTGQPPFRGTLKHAGWRVREIKLPPLPEGQDPFVTQPAEVELP